MKVVITVLAVDSLNGIYRDEYLDSAPPPSFQGPIHMTGRQSKAETIRRHFTQRKDQNLRMRKPQMSFIADQSPFGQGKSLDQINTKGPVPDKNDTGPAFQS
jgi:hypothetical protein